MAYTPITWVNGTTPLSESNMNHIETGISTIDTALGGKVDAEVGKGLSTEDFSTALKTKLDGIAANANDYTHPTNAGNKHIPAGGAAGKVLQYSANGTATWEHRNINYGTAFQIEGTAAAAPVIFLDNPDNTASKERVKILNADTDVFFRVDTCATNGSSPALQLAMNASRCSFGSDAASAKILSWVDAPTVNYDAANKWYCDTKLSAVQSAGVKKDKVNFTVTGTTLDISFSDF